MENKDYKTLAKELKPNIDIMNDTFEDFGLQFQRLGIKVEEGGRYGAFIIEFSLEEGDAHFIHINVILYDDDDVIVMSEWSEADLWDLRSYGKVEVKFENSVLPDAVSGRIFVTGA